MSQLRPKVSAKLKSDLVFSLDCRSRKPYEDYPWGALKVNRYTRSLKLNNISIPLKHLFYILCRMPLLESLILSRFELENHFSDDKEAEWIAEAITKNTSLRSLYLFAPTRHNSSLFMGVFQGLTHNTTLQTLVLKRCDLRVLECPQFICMMESNTTITRLGIGDGIADKRHLLKIASNKTVFDLDISHSYPCESTFRSYLLNARHLQSLNVSNAPITVDELADIMKLPLLRRLVVNNCGIDDSGVEVIVESLNGSVLETLKMNNNFISNIGIRQLLRTVTTNTTLSDLRIRNQMDEEATLVVLAETVRRNSSITRLALGMLHSHIAPFVQSLRLNGALEVLSYCPPLPHGEEYTEIRQHIERNGWNLGMKSLTLVEALLKHTNLTELSKHDL